MRKYEETGLEAGSVMMGEPIYEYRIVIGRLRQTPVAAFQ